MANLQARSEPGLLLSSIPLSSLGLSDTNIYEPEIRALIEPGGGQDQRGGRDDGRGVGQGRHGC